LFCFPALILLIAGIAGARSSGDKYKSLAILTALLFATNFVFYIYPHSRAENNPILSFAINGQKNWTADSVIIYSQFHSDLWTISYFNPQANWTVISNPTLAEMKKRHAHAKRNGYVLWLEKSAHKEISKIPGGQEWLQKNIDYGHSLKEEAPGYSLAFYPLLEADSENQQE
jgi:hypothetical protein